MKPVPVDSAATRRQQPARRAMGPCLLALLLVLCRGMPAFAQEAQVPPVADERHRVEIIVFRHLDQRGTTAEEAQTVEPVTAPATITTALDGSAPPPADTGGAMPMPELSAADLKLGPIAARLRQSPAYRLLYHGGWLQAFDSQERATPTPLPAAARAAGLDGTITLYRENFVHTLLDITLRTPALDATGIEVLHVLRQGRRLRGQSVHYFDHPQFGVILQVE